MATDLNSEVLIVGAGPVGLLLANFLGQSGVRTIIVDKESKPPALSMAIGITPPSLDILRRLKLDQAFIEEGVRIKQAVVRGTSAAIGTLNFDSIDGPYPYILSLPQARTISLLIDGLADYDCVSIKRGLELVHLSQHINRYAQVVLLEAFERKRIVQ